MNGVGSLIGRLSTRILSWWPGSQGSYVNLARHGGESAASGMATGGPDPGPDGSLEVTVPAVEEITPCRLAEGGTVEEPRPEVVGYHEAMALPDAVAEWGEELNMPAGDVPIEEEAAAGLEPPWWQEEANPGGTYQKTSKGGINVNQNLNAVEKIKIKTERVVGHGNKQKFIEETKTLDAIKIVEIKPTLRDIKIIVKEGKAIVQGVVHKQIFFIGTDGLEHHLAEDIAFSELVDIEPVDPFHPAQPGMNAQDFSFVENLVFEFDTDTMELTQKIIVALVIKVTQTDQIDVLMDPFGPFIKTEVVIGSGSKQKFIREEKTIDAVKIVDIVPRLRDVTSIVKNGKVIVQGTIHKQIFFVGTDNLVHHLAEDINFSELVEIVPLDPNVPAKEGMNQQDESRIENIIFEFNPDTGRLVQKIILRLQVKVTDTRQIPVALDPYGTLIKTERVIGEGTKQKFIEETKTLNAIKIVDIIPTLRDVTSVVKDGKVIVQGVVHKQIFFVGTDGLVHHVAEDIDFSEMVEIEPLNPELPVREGMNQQDHSFIENLVFDFNPDTGQLVQKIIIRIEVKVTQTEQIKVADP